MYLDALNSLMTVGEYAPLLSENEIHGLLVVWQLNFSTNLSDFKPGEWISGAWLYRYESTDKYLNVFQQFIYFRH